MTTQITTIIPPTYLAQLTGVYRIDIAPRTVKAYRYDFTLSHRVLRSKLPKGFDTASFADQVNMLLTNAERMGV